MVDKHLGGPEGLAIARRELAKRGMKLLLDFVPNHVAPDHPWVTGHPEYFIHGTIEDVRNESVSYIEVHGSIFACESVCDMAMLLLNQIFERTWGSRAGHRLPTEYWGEVIPAIKRAHPDFRFVAEAYWKLEWELQQQAFDACYDKRLDDRLEHDNAKSVRIHRCADFAYQDKSLRFLENHDEPRAGATLSGKAAGRRSHNIFPSGCKTLP